MHSRVVRVMLVAVLVAVGIGAGVQLTFLAGQVRQLESARRELLNRHGRFERLLGELSLAQAAYVAPGQSDAPWFERVTTLHTSLTTQVGDIRRQLKAAESAVSGQALSDALTSLMSADANARDYLGQGQDLIAADVLFGDGRDAVNRARSAASSLVQSESAWFDNQRGALEEQAALIAGGTAGLWLIGLLLLMPRTKAAPEPATGLAEITRVAPADRGEIPPPGTSVDLAAAADVCTALSRVVTSAALPDMLARISALIDAPGIIVWLSSGDELFAVMSHGYDPRSIRRLGAIARDDDNATAEAWRTGELRIVAGDMVGSGAIVAPMFGPESCVGVLAAEVRHGREQDPATQAVTVMLAAQLAMVVGAWPAAPAARAAEG